MSGAKKPVMVQVPALSIMHLSQVTRSGYLVSQYGDAADDLPFMVAPHDNGYFMTVPACQAQADDEQREEWATIPADLRAVFDFMSPHAKFAWFMLDVDGDMMAGLPMYSDDTTMAGEHCETCGCALESGQTGHCEECAPQFLNCYDCPECGHNWEEESDCGHDSECPECGAENLCPVSSNEVQA